MAASADSSRHGDAPEAARTEESGRPFKALRIVDCPVHGRQELPAILRLTQCPRCTSDTIRSREEGQREERRLRRIGERKARLGLPPRFANATFAQFTCTTAKQRAAVQDCREFAESLPGDGRTLMLIGPCGTGKTTLAAAIANAVIDAKDMAALLMTQRDLIRNLRSTWSHNSPETESQAIERLASVGLLLVDDAGVGHGSESELVQLLDVIDARYANHMPLVVSSNLTGPQLKVALGDRVFDRVRENARVVVCDWPSFRGKAGPP